MLWHIHQRLEASCLSPLCTYVSITWTREEFSWNGPCQRWGYAAQKLGQVDAESPAEPGNSRPSGGVFNQWKGVGDAQCSPSPPTPPSPPLHTSLNQGNSETVCRVPWGWAKVPLHKHHLMTHPGWADFPPLPHCPTPIHDSLRSTFANQSLSLTIDQLLWNPT